MRRSLDSVLGQEYSDFELIIVNDGSTDGSVAVVQSYNDERIKLISQRNQGVSVARNNGVLAARGKWVAFLDADDQYHSQFLKRIAESIVRFPDAGCVYARVDWLKQGEVINLHHGQVEETEAKMLPDYFGHVVFENGLEIHTSGVSIRRDVFDSVGLFPEGVKVGEDSDLWLRVALSTKVVYIPESLSTYFMDAGGSNWEQEQDREAYWLETYRKWLNEGKIPDELTASAEAYRQKYYLAKALRFALLNDKKRARRIIRQHAFIRKAPIKDYILAWLYAYVPRELLKFALRLINKKLSQ